MRYGFVPYGPVDHGNLCGPGDTAELTFLRGRWHVIGQPALLLAKLPPYIRIQRVAARPRSCSDPSRGFQRVSSPFWPARAYADSALFAP